MRFVALLIPVLALPLCACSMFDRNDGGSTAKVNSGYVGPASLDQQHVAQLLADQGYRNITGLHMNGTDWIGQADTSTGQPVDFDIDKDGVIHTK